MKDFKDKVVVIPGGSTGIGLALARQFGALGSKLVIAARKQNHIDEALAELKSKGIVAVGKNCDVSIKEEVIALADFSWDHYGQVDVIINNAGIGHPNKSVLDFDKAAVMKILDVNLFGVWNGISVFGKRFLEQKTPCAIYNVGSENSLFNAMPWISAYSVSKHALLALTDNLRKEMPDFVDVSLICPGLVNSEIGGGIDFGMDTDEFAALVLQQLKVGNFYVVSHSYNMVHIEKRYHEIAESYSAYAPRYKGDIALDVKTMLYNK